MTSEIHKMPSGLDKKTPVSYSFPNDKVSVFCSLLLIEPIDSVHVLNV
jgi:hypothetical protein